MATDREKAIAAAVRAAPEGADLLVIDGRTGRACAASGNWDDNDTTAACIVVAAPIKLTDDLPRMAVRPGRGAADARGHEAADFPLLAPEDRRRQSREGNKAVHALAARGATSALVASSESIARVSDSREAEAAPTRPEEGPGSVQVI